MANSRIMLVCKHCGGEFCIGKGYFGVYSTRNENMHHDLNAFYDAHECGICSDDADCTDNARNHFIILEEGETLADVAPKSEVAREIFEEIEQHIEDVGFSSFQERFEFADFIAELKKKYMEDE